MFSLVQLKQILRRLAGAPVFTGVSLITLAVCIGATTAIFSVVEGVVLKPLDYPRSDQLLGVWLNAPGIGLQKLGVGQFIYFIDREQSVTFHDIGVYASDSRSVTGAGEPEHVKGLDVSDGTLPILGVRPVLGRLFTRQDDMAGAPETVMLTYAYWHKKFGGSRSAIGGSVVVDSKPREIIGVLPKDFHFLNEPESCWEQHIEREIAGLEPDAVSVGAGASRKEIYDYCGRLMRALHYPALVHATHWDNFLIPYEDSQQPSLDALQFFLHEIAAASPTTKVIVPKYFEPIPLAK